MKKAFTLLLIVLMSWTVVAHAFLYDIEINTPEQLSKLSDTVLIDKYIEAKIEEKASGEFHVSAGFSSKKDYDKRKELIRYLFDLKREISKRESLQIESVDSFLE